MRIILYQKFEYHPLIFMSLVDVAECFYVNVRYPLFWILILGPSVTFCIISDVDTSSQIVLLGMRMRFLWDYGVSKRKMSKTCFSNLWLIGIEVKQNGPRKHDETATASHEHAFTYNIMVGDHKQKVCLSAFKSL